MYNNYTKPYTYWYSIFITKSGKRNLDTPRCELDITFNPKPKLTLNPNPPIPTVKQELELTLTPDLTLNPTIQ